jgi:hypothetical protein
MRRLITYRDRQSRLWYVSEVARLKVVSASIDGPNVAVVIRFEREGEQRFARWIGGTDWREQAELHRLFERADNPRDDTGVGPALPETVALWVKAVASMGPDELADFEARTFKQWEICGCRSPNPLEPRLIPCCVRTPLSGRGLSSLLRRRGGERAAAPWSRYHARDLLERAETAAELPQLDGGDFHAYRRAWATARKHLPAADVAHAGGWRDLRSLERSYQRVDDETLLAVVTEPRKLRDAKQR